MQESRPDSGRRKCHVSRRLVRVALAATALALAVLPQSTAAQDYPSRPIRMVSASAAGSGSDVVLRLLSARLSENFGQQIVVDNRPGASGLIGAELTAKAPPDGYTLWLATLTQLISTTLHNRLLLAKEFAPVGLVATTPFIIVVGSALPVTSAADVLAADAEVAVPVSPPPCGTISIAQICGFSTLGVKVTFITPLVASTLTVST